MITSSVFFKVELAKQNLEQIQIHLTQTFDEKQSKLIQDFEEKEKKLKSEMEEKEKKLIAEMKEKNINFENECARRKAEKSKV